MSVVQNIKNWHKINKLKVLVLVFRLDLLTHVQPSVLPFVSLSNVHFDSDRLSFFLKHKGKLRKHSVHNTTVIITSLQACYWVLARHIWLKGVKNNSGTTEKTQQCFLWERQHFLSELNEPSSVILAFLQSQDIRMTSTGVFLSCGRINNAPLILIMSLWTLNDLTLFY